MFIIGIAGGSGSGKSTFAQKITSRVNDSDVIQIPQDWFYRASQPKSTEINGKPNFDHPDAFDWPLLHAVLLKLKDGESADCPVYDFKTDSRLTRTQTVGPAKLILFEGIYALWDERIRDLLNLKIFLHVDADIRFIRRLHRDVRERGRSLDSVINQYYDSVRPMHRQYIEPTRQFADLLVGEETDIPAQVVASHISAILGA